MPVPSIPTVDPEPLIVLEVTLRPVVAGATLFGQRREVFFEGTATSSLWDGEWEVSGIDHSTTGTGGVVRIDVHTTTSGPDEVLTYRDHGRGGPDGVAEGVTFDTPGERLARLNTTLAVGRGALDGDHLTIALHPIKP